MLTALEHAISVVLIPSYSDIFVCGSAINCILITQMRLQNAYKLHAELQTRMGGLIFIDVKNSELKASKYSFTSQQMYSNSCTGPGGSRRLRLPDFKTIGT